MALQQLNGKCYARMLLGGAALLKKQADRINGLNVFPVADGDTGTNMASTMDGGLSAIAASGEESIGATSESFSRGVLLAARGNSGVILSQIFAGINEGLSGRDAVTVAELASAYKLGIAKSYAAVQNPTEGTILTVFRESAEYAAERMNENSTVEDFFRIHTEEARRSLAATKELLPVLKEADVIDSGGAGYLCIAEGMYGALTGKPTAEFRPADTEKPTLDLDSFTRDSVLEYGYCTEFLLRLTTSKTAPDAFDVSTLISELTAMGGESIVAYKQDDAVKVHVHTFNPAAALALGQKYGEFLTVKIENMSVGHTGGAEKKQKSNKKFSVIAVASGEGMSALFKDMGADRIVSGGQTSNPSIREFMDAFEECDTPEIILLPNNKNVILAANQAADLYTKANVRIVETKNLMEGYAALSVITPGITDMEALTSSALRAAQSCTCGEVTVAVRDTVLDSRPIHAGDYIAISDGAIKAVALSPEDAVTEFLSTVDTDLAEIITVFVGKGVPDGQRTALTETLKETCPDCEIAVHIGGQEVYRYMIAVE